MYALYSVINGGNAVKIDNATTLEIAKSKLDKLAQELVSIGADVQWFTMDTLAVGQFTAFYDGKVTRVFGSPV